LTGGRRAPREPRFARAPPLREEAYRWRPLGRSYDPRMAVIKDTPGPLVVHEIGLEASL